MHADIAKERFLELMAAGLKAEQAADTAIVEADIFMTCYEARKPDAQPASKKTKGCRACHGSGGKIGDPCRVCNGSGRVPA